MRFCAICTSERGPFSMQPLGRNDAMVSVCEACNDPLSANQNKRAPMRVISAVREYQKLTAPERSNKRRETNARLGRCINHPLSDKPHGPRLPGLVRCAHCHEKHSGKKVDASRIQGGA